MDKYFILYCGGDRCKKINAESSIHHANPFSIPIADPALVCLFRPPPSSGTRRNDFIHRRRQHKVLLRHWCTRPSRRTTTLRVPIPHRRFPPDRRYDPLRLLQSLEELGPTSIEEHERTHDDDMSVPSQALPRQDRILRGEQDEGRCGIVEDHRREDDPSEVV